MCVCEGGLDTEGSPCVHIVYVNKQRENNGCHWRGIEHLLINNGRMSFSKGGG